MSAEFMTEYNDNSVSAAVENMEYYIEHFGEVTDYIVTIQEAYAQYPEGSVELHRMTRAAQLITNRKAGDLSEEVQAVYHGQLLGIELVNNLEPGIGTHFKTGYAQTFFQTQLQESRPKDTWHAETSLEQTERLIQLSLSIQDDLSQPEYIGGLNPRYEQFGQKITSKLTNESMYQELAMMGFRMILKEAHAPSTLEFSPEQNHFIEQVVENAVVENLDRTTFENEDYYDDNWDDDTAGERLADGEAPDIADVEKIVGKPFELDWENISDACAALYAEYKRLEKIEKEMNDDLESPVSDISEMSSEELLIAFNENNNYIYSHDLLSVTGDQFIIEHSKDADSNMYKLDEDSEIRGIIEGISFVMAPSKKQMEHLKQGGKSSRKKYIPVPAIRILNPIAIVTYGENKTHKEYHLGPVMDIPLNYGAEFRRLKAEELEDEA